MTTSAWTTPNSAQASSTLGTLARNMPTYGMKLRKNVSTPHSTGKSTPSTHNTRVTPVPVTALTSARSATVFRPTSRPKVSRRARCSLLSPRAARTARPRNARPSARREHHQQQYQHELTHGTGGGGQHQISDQSDHHLRVERQQLACFGLAAHAGEPAVERGEPLRPLLRVHLEARPQAGE